MCFYQIRILVTLNLYGDFRMMHSAKFLLAVCAGVGMFSLAQGSAQAATLNYNLTGSNSTGSSFLLTSPGAPNLTVSAFTGCSNVATYAGCSIGTVGRNADGMGVGNNANAQIGDDEILRLFFNQMVRVVSVTFSDMNAGSDRFNLAIDTITKVANGNPDNTDPVTVILANSPFNLTGAQRSGFYFDFSNAAYKLQSITVDYGTDVVPTPALLPGLVGLGLGVIRRRKQQAALA
jgi:hypothetical protein